MLAIRSIRSIHLMLAGLLALAAALLPAIGMAQITINQEAKLYDPAPPATGGHSGAIVSVSGDTAAVGAPDLNSGTGAVYIYVRNAGTSIWSMQKILTASDGKAGDAFGGAVSISGNNVAVGAPGRASNQGAVYTFNRSGTTWTQGTILTASGGAAGDALGFSVSIEGLTIVAGAPHSAVSTRADAGTAYVFTSLNGGLTWQQQFHIQVTSGQARGGDHIGWSVALSQGTVLAGAPDDDSGSKLSVGSVYVFIRNGTAWSKQTKITPGGGTTNMRFGDAVALLTNTAIIGADGRNSAQGSAYVYTRGGTTWTLQSTLNATGGAAGDRFGSAVAISGSQAVVGAPQANNTGAASGKAYLFSNTAGTFQETAVLVATDNAAGDNFGAGVAQDSGRALVGAPFNAAGAITGNGAAYSFVTASASATSITSIAPEPSALNQSYTVNVQVASNPAGNGTPSGTVAVSDGAGSNCTATLASGTGSCALVSATAGTLTISADYSSDAVFGASSATASHSVTGGATTTTISSEAPDPSVVGQAVTATVAVAVVPPATGTPTGPVTVSDGTANCTVPDISLGNTCLLTFAAAGTTNLIAVYGGDANFNSSSSNPATPHVTNKADTTTAIVTETPDPSYVGQAVTVTAAVSAVAPGSGTPAGKVTVTNGTTSCVINDIAVSNSCQITFTAAGSSNLSASYAGNANYNPSSSTSVAHTTTAVSTTTAIVSEAPDPSFAGQWVAVAVSVTPAQPGSVAPTGQIVISDDVDGSVTCTIADIAANNSCVLSFNIVGGSQLTATYAGDSNFLGSASTPVAHTVSAPTALHLAFGQQPSDILRGNRLGNGVTVQVLDAGNALQTSDNSTQITLTAQACGKLVAIGPVTAVGGVATFNNIGPHFYTLASGLKLGTQSNPAYTPDTSAAFNVTANSDLLSASDFESCRL